MTAVVEQFRLSIDDREYQFPPSLEEGLSEVRHIEARLAIRLGELHPAAEAFRLVVVAVDGVKTDVEQAGLIVEERGSREFRDLVTAGQEEIREAIRQFLQEART